MNQLEHFSFKIIILLAVSLNGFASNTPQARHACRAADGSTFVIDDRPFKTNRPVLQRTNIMDKSEGLVHAIMPDGNRNAFPLTKSYLDAVDPNYVHYEFRTQPKTSHLGALIGPRRTQKIKVNIANPREAWILEERLDQSKRWHYLNCDSQSRSKVSGGAPDLSQWKKEDVLVDIAPPVAYKSYHSDEPGVKNLRKAVSSQSIQPKGAAQSRQKAD